MVTWPAENRTVQYPENETFLPKILQIPETNILQQTARHINYFVYQNSYGWMKFYFQV